MKRYKQSMLLKNIVIMTGVLISVGDVYAQQVAGWIEKAMLVDDGIVLKAKLDTGADNSSLNAAGYTIVKKDGGKWASFKLTNYAGDSVDITKRIVRFTKIKRKNLPAKRRPVIKIAICIGDVNKTVEVNLADRSNYKYQLLIGRSFLKQSILVDSFIKYSHEPTCKAGNAVNTQ